MPLVGQYIAAQSDDVAPFMLLLRSLLYHHGPMHIMQLMQFGTLVFVFWSDKIVDPSFLGRNEEEEVRKTVVRKTAVLPRIHLN